MSEVPMMELRSAQWWSEYWQENYVEVLACPRKYDLGGGERNAKGTSRAQVGRINSRTENTSTRQGFFTSRQTVDKEAERYSFLTKDQAPEEEEEDDCGECEDLFGDEDETLAKPKEYPWIGSITNRVISIPRNTSEKSKLIDPLFEESGAVFVATQISYSSGGKSGSADGAFSSTIVGSQDESYFEQRQARERASGVDSFEKNIRQFFSTLLNDWWCSANDSSEKLLVNHSSIARKKKAGRDRYGPTYQEENIEILSVTYESEGKEPITICTFIKDRSYYG
ncbi:hypothetical protein NAEGRDRAFT_81398 [Naegleria gruberi]|uniref:Uncharacterized protein n=1 Tax=Naegleria gruberi TaxID=5762 RepID=D2VVM9_NAEGR|nr:uncharacterized protein NAEGRDRAFT_81398 [Naegleria gruberi]EFC39133.1 hypothetical protein NAEGRDRAFT_81398 [Naegleria gruberi]|eukprot:XP_002671877.1 hypothetical protein NAEGRDRAFT_81398 [Naegleria gruberi strain NEG-M]